MSSQAEAVVQQSINAIRTLSIDAIDQANSGHPGLPLGAAPMAYTLWYNHLKHNPSNPAWANRDRFVLSAGHGSMLLYSLLHLFGYPLSLDEIRAFRQWGSKTPGHPEFGHTAGVEATTGPLGQGFANGVGMAVAERALANRFNRPDATIIDHFTYVLCSDGDLMEGIASEAASLAGHLKLGKLIALFDSNDICLDGPTAVTFTEDVGRRFEAYGWHVQQVNDANHDVAGIDRAIAAAKEESGRPSLIICRTQIGYGAPGAGTSKVHGAPLGANGSAATKAALQWPHSERFVIPKAVARHFAQAAASGAKAEREWQRAMAAYRKKCRAEAQELDAALAGELPAGWDADIPSYEGAKDTATRSASGEVLNAFAPKVPLLLGTDADLSSSTKAEIKPGGNFDGQTGAGRNVRCGVREHAMGALANGIAYHGGLRAFASTFFVFSDYMRPAVRLAAMNGLPVVYVWSHDSVAVGEDGPTHQPIEQLMSLRLIPNLSVIRPADAKETAAAWRAAMRRTSGPTALILTRQNLPVLGLKSSAVDTGVRRGGYIVAEASAAKPKAVLFASGSEVSVALAARDILESKKIATRVVSMPSWDLFEAQSASYRAKVLAPECRVRASIEAGCTLGWERYVGADGLRIGIDRFGASAPGDVNLKKFGFTADRVAAAVLKVARPGRS